MEVRVKALKNAIDEARRRLVELIGLKEKLKHISSALVELIEKFERHFDHVRGVNKFEVEQCFSRYFPGFSSPRSFIVELKS